ncbi:MAG: HIRAN domain-containing protein [Azonexus sp.]|nr:HIRAN domain-containing protein [Azonexus sp.]MDZ4314114.1 HIRAN domain-containing protein [Azonexus sp.]
MRFLLTISLLLLLGNARAESIRILIQSSPLAGSQYYAANEMWLQMKVGDHLELIREPDNRHDRNAVRVEWRGHKLGYLPRSENRAVAAAIDQGDKLVARIARLTEHPNPWQRVEFEVFAEL